MLMFDVRQYLQKGIDEIDDQIHALESQVDQLREAQMALVKAQEAVAGLPRVAEPAAQPTAAPAEAEPPAAPAPAPAPAEHQGPASDDSVGLEKEAVRRVVLGSTKERMVANMGTVTLTNVRNVVCDVLRKELKKNPRKFIDAPGAGRREKLKRLPGYFIVRDLAEAMGVHYGNPKLHEHLQELESKGVLKSAAYLNPRTRQYCYVEPTAQGPNGSAATDRAVDRGATFGGVGADHAGTGKAERASDKDMMKLINKARRQGFTVERLGNDHFKIQKVGSPAHVILPGTPSGMSAYNVAKDKLKQMGVRV